MACREIVWSLEEFNRYIKDGESVALVRYPYHDTIKHSLVVNPNKNDDVVEYIPSAEALLNVIQKVTYIL